MVSNSKTNSASPKKSKGVEKQPQTEQQKKWCMASDACEKKKIVTGQQNKQKILDSVEKIKEKRAEEERLKAEIARLNGAAPSIEH